MMEWKEVEHILRCLVAEEQVTCRLDMGNKTEVKIFRGAFCLTNVHMVNIEMEDKMGLGRLE